MILSRLISGLIITVLFISVVFGQEVIIDFDNETVPVLNNELRKMRDDIKTITKNDTTWTNYTALSTIDGWSSFTDQRVYYRRTGHTVFVTYSIIGTSDAAGTNFTLPYNCSEPDLRFFSGASDNGGAIDTGYAALDGGTNRVEFYKDEAANVFTNSGTKFVKGQFWYEIE